MREIRKTLNFVFFERHKDEREREREKENKQRRG